MRNIKLAFLALYFSMYFGFPLEEINDGNFESKVLDAKNKKWMIVFYVDTCSHCGHAMDILERLANEQEIINRDYSIGKVDCLQNTFLCSSYDITAIPHIVLLDKEMYIYNEYPTYQSLRSFLLIRNRSEGVTIPTLIGYTSLFFKLLSEFLISVDGFFQSLARSFGYDFTWTRNHTYITLFLLLILLILFEITYIFYCCSPKHPDRRSKFTEAQLEAIEKAMKEEIQEENSNEDRSKSKKKKKTKKD